ncbi:uncharacterized protein LOC105797561 [Gossypium raimondii]|uniref:uncharacterized protein LOC105797561 n=1 Tax=Gossypium raimondii TaxID=29730 RepID=UPI00227D23F6|nr:uncharacterized protein LOC105797561 [Gossypium raimondii]
MACKWMGGDGRRWDVRRQTSGDGGWQRASGRPRLGSSWVCGYSMTLGKDKVFRIEARSMLEVFQLAWDKGYQQVELESDNALLVELMLAGNSTASHIAELRAFHKILHRNWKVHIRHIPKAPNEVVDFMAKHAASSFTSIQVFSIPPQAIRRLIQKDNLSFNL